MEILFDAVTFSEFGFCMRRECCGVNPLHPQEPVEVKKLLLINDGARIGEPPVLGRASTFYDYMENTAISLSPAWSSVDGVGSSRRSFIVNSGSIPLLVWEGGMQKVEAATDLSSFDGLLSQVQQARKQMDSIPALIDSEKWDSVRAILIEPPLADCWAKTSRPLLTKYAEVLGDTGGDELAALEAREEIVSHLRYLDMAVYNNVFNPIKAEGQSGATKELIRSYYEDPINEYKASTTALDELIKLAKEM
eukprot:scaffold3437_cov113-Cylindrotheca_fusiformis.AAC.51